MTATLTVKGLTISIDLKRFTTPIVDRLLRFKRKTFLTDCVVEVQKELEAQPDQILLVRRWIVSGPGTKLKSIRFEKLKEKLSMASAPPDPHPDSPPTGPDEIPEQLPPAGDDGRESVEDIPASGTR